MTEHQVSVAVPVHNGGAWLDRTLAAVRRQRTDRSFELLVCDSGSTDGSVDRARAHGARVIAIAPGEFSHSRTRNLLMEQAEGEQVAFLSQDSEPAAEDWLETLLAGFGLADDVALCFGPYRPRPDAPVWVARELEEWFESLSPSGAPRLDRVQAGESPAATDLLGARAFFTDANGAVARRAWEQIRFPDVPYAEDHALALAMLRAGWAKVYLPDAPTLHSHAHRPGAHFRRCFDEWRGLREVYGHREPAGPRRSAAAVRRGVSADLARLRSRGVAGGALLAAAGGSSAHHVLRQLGAIGGSRAERLPPWLRRACSLEGRETFEPLER